MAAGTLAPRTEPLRTLAFPFLEDLYTALRQHVQAGQVVAALSVVIRSGSGTTGSVVPAVVGSGLGISRRLGWSPGVRVQEGAPALLAH
ncbi:MAG: hypothetical protein J2P35_20625 [Actinobacteria bacterium]|nr:hypothetical protein [Actinomycetota bacterium]